MTDQTEPAWRPEDHAGHGSPCKEQPDGSCAGPVDTCRPVEVDGETVHVRGNGDFTEQDAKFFGEIVRAAKRKYEAEHSPAQGVDEEAQRTTRRDALRNLFHRIDRGVTRGIHFTSAEAPLLRQHVEAEIRDADTARRSAEQAEAERDGAYRERAHLVALLAAMTDGAVIAYARDIDEPGWQIVYLTIGGRQASWHISPRDADLFAHVERVDVEDPRAQWDGHTTEEKYAAIAEHAAELAQRCGPACSEQHTERGRCEIARNR